MFRCQNESCSQMVVARQPVNRIVTESRKRTYEKKIRRGRNKGNVETVHGWEVVKEINVCPQCYALLTGKAPRVVEVIKPKVSEFRNKPRSDKYKKPHKESHNKRSTSSKKPIVETVAPLTKT